jgi:Protein of unknown function (DUF3307)
MLELILKIILAHLLGDFVFQTNRMVEDIEQKKLKSIYLYIHAVIHFLLVLIVTKFEKQYILAALILAIIHLTIDVITKIVIKEKVSSIGNLVIDQVLHITTIALFVKYFYDYRMDFTALFNMKNYLLSIAIVSITYVSAVLIRKIMEFFAVALPNEGIKDAGKYIGMLERLFIFMFIVTSFREGIGFLLAAKSIFRFGDLKDNKEIKLTEYILIGTLLSFGIAMLIGEIYLRIKAYAVTIG